MISMGVDWGKPGGDETAVVICRVEDDGTCTILAGLRGDAAEYVAKLKAKLEASQCGECEKSLLECECG